MSEPLRPDMFRPECPSAIAPIQIADKWGGLVIVCLEGGPRRFSELRVPLHKVAPKVLTETLRALERDGFVARTVFDENPPRVEYALTELGRTLLEPIAACQEWAAANFPSLIDARQAWEQEKVTAA